MQAFFYFCICACSAKLSMFHMEKRSRNTLIIIIIIVIVIIIIIIIIIKCTAGLKQVTSAGPSLWCLLEQFRSGLCIRLSSCYVYYWFLWGIYLLVAYPSVTRSAAKVPLDLKLRFFSRRLWTWDKRQTKSATVKPQICNYSATYKPLLFFQRDGPRAIAPRVTGLV